MEEAKISLGQRIDKKVDELIEKNMPKGKEATRTNWWLGTCATMVATGLYTGLIDWNPVVRTAAHLTGAMAIPAVGAFASSVVMSGIEKVANAGINVYNKKHPERKKDIFKINPKVKDVVKLISAATVGIAYTYGTLGTEVDQFARSGIFQAHQYIADIAGAATGIVAFNKLEPKETITSFMNKVNILSKAIVKPINSLEERVMGKEKDKDHVAISPDPVAIQTQDEWLAEMKERYGKSTTPNYNKNHDDKKRTIQKDYEVDK